MTDDEDLLIRFSANWAASLEGTMHSLGGRVLRWPEGVATDAGRPAGLQNSVVLLEPLREDAVPSLMPALDGFFNIGVAKHAGAVHLFSAWPVPDLAHHGWVLVEQMPLMARRPGGQAPPLPPDLHVSEVRSLADLHHFERVMIEGFPVPELQGLPPGSVFGPGLLDDQRFHFWLGWYDNKPATAAASYISHGLVAVIFLATLPQARGRGFGSALAWTATLADPVLPAMLIASEEGQRLYTRMGYRHICDMPLWIRERP